MTLSLVAAARLGDSDVSVAMREDAADRLELEHSVVAFAAAVDAIPGHRGASLDEIALRLDASVAEYRDTLSRLMTASRGTRADPDRLSQARDVAVRAVARLLRASSEGLEASRDERATAVAGAVLGIAISNVTPRRQGEPMPATDRVRLLCKALRVALDTDVEP
jgi:hypothetical protein